MKRFQSILCASLLTLSISSAALAGQISGAPNNVAGQISGAPDNVSGQISGRSGQISGIAGQISGLIFGLLIP